MIRATGGLVGPAGNGGAEAARVAEAFRAEDERRREQLDRLCKMAGPERRERRLSTPCPACGSRAAHRLSCPRHPRAGLDAPRAIPREPEPPPVPAFIRPASRPSPVVATPVYCMRCGHSMSIHRGIVCHGLNSRGGRCRCDCGGNPCSTP